MSDTSPLTLTTNPRLSQAVAGDGPGFEAALLDVGLDTAETWFRNRVRGEVDPVILHDALASWFEATSADDRVLARVDLAELMADVDDAVSELLWDASMRDGFERDDGDQIFDAVSHLSQLVEAAGDPLAAAEYHIEFLNWRRADGHISEPESVHQAFEEIVRLAELDGRAAGAARFAHAHSIYTRIADGAEELAVEGDWAPGSPEFSGWD